jgi:nitrate reductase alpha subunit
MSGAAGGAMAFPWGAAFASPLRYRQSPGLLPRARWEKIYRDQYRYDKTFSWVCSPNDTHACRCLAYTRNGVITRMGSQYDYRDLQ